MLIMVILIIADSVRTWVKLLSQKEQDTHTKRLEKAPTA
jgi:carbon starvation protein